MIVVKVFVFVEIPTSWPDTIGPSKPPGKLPAKLGPDEGIPLAKLGKDEGIPLAKLGPDEGIPLAKLGPDEGIPLEIIDGEDSNDVAGNPISKAP